MIRQALIIALLLIASAMPQQRTIYGNDGRETIDTQGTRTLYGSDGRVVTRETTTRNGSVIYDAQSGRAIARTTREGWR